MKNKKTWMYVAAAIVVLLLLYYLLKPKAAPVAAIKVAPGATNSTSSLLTSIFPFANTINTDLFGGSPTSVSAGGTGAPDYGYGCNGKGVTNTCGDGTTVATPNSVCADGSGSPFTTCNS
jgi:hypothetical protein